MTLETQFKSEDDYWNAIVGNDSRANGVFFYAVKTTGVYCLPSCSSRLPNRSNVEFFRTSNQAERKGYRACKRCKPESFSGNKIPDAVVHACNLIDNADKPLPLESLAQAVGLSPFYFHRLFKKTVGVTPRAYISARRAQRFRDGLQDKETVTEAMYDAGYRASSRCYETVGANLGMTPTQYKKGGIDQTIQFTVVECTLGWIAVAATERGVCSIEIGDDADDLRNDVAVRFAEAKLMEGSPTFLDWVSQVVAYVESPDDRLNLPIDIQGTVFQRKVWEALQRVPVGMTATYSEIADQIGKHTAVRAVAGACAANKLAVVIPCHRIVRNDGTIGGYRWGVERKRELLKREAGATADS